MIFCFSLLLGNKIIKVTIYQSFQNSLCLKQPTFRHHIHFHHMKKVEPVQILRFVKCLNQNWRTNPITEATTRWLVLDLRYFDSKPQFRADCWINPRKALIASTVLKNQKIGEYR